MPNYITIPEFETLSEQEVFNMSARHLLTQMEQSTDPYEGGVCLYRGPEGRMCAAGMFIADEHALRAEHKTWDLLVNLRKAPRIHLGLVVSLQTLHDHYAPEEWADRLHDLATRLGLSTAVVDELRNKEGG